MTPSVTVTVTGHRINKAQLKKQPELRTEIRLFTEAFAEALCVELGEQVSEMIQRGEWWRSRSPRFARYRSWVRLNYGSDRNRSMGKPRRQATKPETRMDMDQTDMDAWSNVQHLMTNWLIRKLRTASVRSESRGRTRVYITGLRTGSGAIEVTQAVDYLDRMSQKMQSAGGYTRQDGTAVTAKEHRRQMLESVVTASDSRALRSLKTTPYGQRLWRIAEIEAVREYRQIMARRSEREGGNRRQRRNQARSGGYIWGYQSGKLANAWKDTSYTLKMNVWKHRITVFPGADDTIKGNDGNTYSLTGLLMRKQGFGRSLLPQRRLHAAVNNALQSIQGHNVVGDFRVRLRKSE